MTRREERYSNKALDEEISTEYAVIPYSRKDIKAR
jgi:hypothetical protein